MVKSPFSSCLKIERAKRRLDPHFIFGHSKPSLFFNSGFQPSFDPDLCVACETCLDRCPASALAMGDDDVPEVDLDRCFGCAVCATGCPEEAITMEEKPDYPEPPKDMQALLSAMAAGQSSKSA